MEDIITFLTNLTNGQIMLICIIAFLITLIFPRLIREKKLAGKRFESRKEGRSLSSEDLKFEKKHPYTHNGRASEIEELLVKVKSYARLNRMKIVFPGMIKWDGKAGQSTMLLVGRFGILSIRCLGFGGEISAENKGKNWVQIINGEKRTFEDPVQISEQDCALIEKALTAEGFPGVRVSGVSIFTKSDVMLTTARPGKVFDRQGFVEWLCNHEAFLKDNGLDVEKVTEKLVALVKAGHENGKEEKK